MVLLLAVSLFLLLPVRSVLAEEPSMRVKNVAVPAKVLPGQSFTAVVSVEWSALNRMTGENLPGGGKMPFIPLYVLQAPYRFEVRIGESWSDPLGIKADLVTEYSGSKKYDIQLTAPRNAKSWKLTASFGLVVSFEVGTVKFIDCTVAGDKQEFSVNVTDKVTVTIQIEPERLNIPISIEGSQVNTDAAGKIQHQLTHGQRYTIQVPSEFSIGTGARIVFAKWSDGQMSNSRTLTPTDDTTLKAEYTIQYLLTVNPLIGNPQGSGWYDQGSTATFSVMSPWPLGGFLGMFGGKYVFRSWSGDSTAATTSASVTMNGPKTVIAEWSTDNTMPYIILGAIGAAIIVVVVLTITLKRKGCPTTALNSMRP